MRIVSLSTLALALSAPAFAASPGQADICHWDDTTNTASVITVSVRAVPAHVANHGDSYAALYFSDTDGDGYGDAAGETDRCPNAGFVADNTDCDDADATVNPGVEEIPYDGVDNDCAAGTADDDLDNDGYLLADDCDDGDATVNPGAEDVCDDGIDNNCDGTIDEECAGDCPCFTAADIDAAYAAYLDIAGTYSDVNNNYLQCAEQTYHYSYSGGYSYDEDYTYVYFNAFSGDVADYNYYHYYQAYEQSYSGFYGITYEQDYYGSHYENAYCNGYTGTHSYDGVNYGNQQTNNYVGALTDAEVDACQAVVVDWAADNAIECPAVDYSYSY